MKKKAVIEDKQQIYQAIKGDWHSSVAAKLIEEATSNSVALKTFVDVVRDLVMMGLLMEVRANYFLTQEVLPVAKAKGLVPENQFELRAINADNLFKRGG